MDKEYAGEILLKHRKNKEWISKTTNNDRIGWLYKDNEYKSKLFNARKTLRHQDVSTSHYKTKSGWGTVRDYGSYKTYHIPPEKRVRVDKKNRPITNTKY